MAKKRGSSKIDSLLSKKISNRLSYTIIAAFALIFIGIGVFANTNGAPNPGHTMAQLEGWAVNGSGSFPTHINYKDGRIGIGTTSPKYALDIQGSAASSPNSIRVAGPNYNTFLRLDTTSTLPTIVFGNGTSDGSTTDLASIQYQAFEGRLCFWFGSGCKVYIDDTGNVGIGSGVSGPAGKLDVGNGNFIITNDGNVGIGTSTPLSLLHVIKNTSNSYGAAYAAITGSNQKDGGAGVIATGITGYGTGSSSAGVSASGNSYDFYAFGPGTDYGSASSGRWKTDVQPITNALDTIMNINGVSFNWDMAHGGQHDIGFIGEQVGQYLPEIVEFDPDSQDSSYYVTGLDYSKLTPVLVEAIKELQTENNALKELVCQDHPTAEMCN